MAKFDLKFLKPMMRDSVFHMGRCPFVLSKEHHSQIRWQTCHHLHGGHGQNAKHAHEEDQRGGFAGGDGDIFLLAMPQTVRTCRLKGITSGPIDSEGQTAKKTTLIAIYIYTTCHGYGSKKAHLMSLFF